MRSLFLILCHIAGHKHKPRQHKSTLLQATTCVATALLAMELPAISQQRLTEKFESMCKVTVNNSTVFETCQITEIQAVDKQGRIWNESITIFAPISGHTYKRGMIAECPSKNWKTAWDSASKKCFETDWTTVPLPGMNREFITLPDGKTVEFAVTSNSLVVVSPYLAVQGLQFSASRGSIR